jgi:capsular polysaccharide biosynthesis protein
MVRHSHRDLIVSPDDRQIYREVTERLHVPGLVPGHEKIFISRLSQTRVSQSYRGLMNEEELIAALSDLGFIAIEPEQLIFAEQVATFAAARIIVGLGGAGMFNTIFCQPQTKVVTIESGTSFVNAHTNLFASMDCDYGVILGEEDPTDPRTVHRRWSLDVPAAIAQLKRSIL